MNIHLSEYDGTKTLFKAGLSGKKGLLSKPSNMSSNPQKLCTR